MKTTKTLPKFPHKRTCGCKICWDLGINGWKVKKKPQVELDGEITLYESSLGVEPFKK